MRKAERGFGVASARELLVVEHHDRIDTRSAPRRDEARRRGGRDHKNGGRGEGEGIDDADAEDQPPHRTGEQQHTTQPTHYADNCVAYAAAHDGADDGCGCGAERDSDPHLTTSEADRVGDHAVDAHRAQYEADGRKGAEQYQY